MLMGKEMTSLSRLKLGVRAIVVGLMIGRFLTFCSLLFLSGGVLQAQAWKGEVHPDIPALEGKAEEGDPAAMAEFAFHSMRCMGGLKYQPKGIFDYFTRSAVAGNESGKVGLVHYYAFKVACFCGKALLQRAPEIGRGENDPRSARTGRRTDCSESPRE